MPYLTLQAGLELQSDSSAGPGPPDRGMLSTEQEPGAAAGACGARHGRGQAWCEGGAQPQPNEQGDGDRAKTQHPAPRGELGASLATQTGSTTLRWFVGQAAKPGLHVLRARLGRSCPSSHQPEGIRRAGWRSRTPAGAPTGVRALLHPEIKPQRQGKLSHTFRRRGHRVIFIASFSLLLPIS